MYSVTQRGKHDKRKAWASFADRAEAEKEFLRLCQANYGAVGRVTLHIEGKRPPVFEHNLLESPPKSLDWPMTLPSLPKEEDGETFMSCLRLAKDTKETARRLGLGNLTAGIREALIFAEQEHLKTLSAIFNKAGYLVSGSRIHQVPGALKLVSQSITDWVVVDHLILGGEKVPGPWLVCLDESRSGILQKIRLAGIKGEKNASSY